MERRGADLRRALCHQCQPVAGFRGMACWRDGSVVARYRLQPRDRSLRGSATAPSRSGRSPPRGRRARIRRRRRPSRSCWPRSPGPLPTEIEADVLRLRSGTNGLVPAAAPGDSDAAGDRGRARGRSTPSVENTASANTVTAVPALDQPGDAHVRRRHGRRRHRLQHGLGRVPRVAGDEITFGPIAITLMACPERPAAGVEQVGARRARAGWSRLTVADDVLTLMKGDEGLMYVAGIEAGTIATDGDGPPRAGNDRDNDVAVLALLAATHAGSGLRSTATASSLRWPSSCSPSPLRRG